MTSDKEHEMADTFADLAKSINEEKVSYGNAF